MRATALLIGIVVVLVAAAHSRREERVAGEQAEAAAEWSMANAPCHDEAEEPTAVADAP